MSVKPPSPRERKKAKKQKTPSPPKETFKPAPIAPTYAPQIVPKAAPERQAPPTLPQNMKVKAPGVFKPRCGPSACCVQALPTKSIVYVDIVDITIVDNNLMLLYFIY